MKLVREVPGRAAAASSVVLQDASIVPHAAAAAVASVQAALHVWGGALPPAAGLSEPGAGTAVPGGASHTAMALQVTEAAARQVPASDVGARAVSDATEVPHRLTERLAARAAFLALHASPVVIPGDSERDRPLVKAMQRRDAKALERLRNPFGISAGDHYHWCQSRPLRDMLAAKIGLRFPYHEYDGVRSYDTALAPAIRDPLSAYNDRRLPFALLKDAGIAPATLSMVAAYGLMETLSGRDVDHAGVLLFGAAYADVVDLCRAPPLLDPLAPNRASRVALALHLRTRTEADDNAPIVLAGLPFTVRRRFAAPLRALDCGDGSTSLARAKLLLGLTRADTTAQAALPLARALFAHLQAATLPPGAGRFDATVLHGDVIPVVAGFGPEALWRNPRARAYVPNRPHDPPAADRTKLPMYFVDLPVVDAPDSYIITDGTARLDFANFVTRGGLVPITHDEMLVRRVHRGVIADIALVAAPYQRSGGGDAADT